MALSAKVVNFIRLCLLDDAHQIARVAQITIVQLKSRIFNMRILKDLVDALGVKRAGPALDAVDKIPLLQQKFR